MLGVSRFVLRHRVAAAVFWLVMLLAGAVASAKLGSRLSGQFAIPGAASYPAMAVLIDATVVRLVLLPAVMELLGKANWWLPRPLGRLLPAIPAGEARSAASGDRGAGGDRRAGDQATAGGVSGEAAAGTGAAGAGAAGTGAAGAGAAGADMPRKER